VGLSLQSPLLVITNPQPTAALRISNWALSPFTERGIAISLFLSEKQHDFYFLDCEAAKFHEWN